MHQDNFFTKRWPKVAVFLFGLFMVTTQVTDADLLDIEVIPDNVFEATTLDFSNRQTANGYATATLFSVVGMVPGGFQVESLRVQQEAELPFEYQITTELSAGSQAFCENLSVRVLRDFETIYTGSLQDFILNGSVGEESQKYDDLVFFVSLPSADVALMNQTCNFNFKLQTILEESGFFDEELVQNQITSGTWSQ